MPSYGKLLCAPALLLGLHPRLEGEEVKVAVPGFQGGDRVQIGLPRVQEELLQKVAAVQIAVVEVENTGSRSGEEVVQLYMRTAGASGPRPGLWLAGFERVALRAGEKKTVRFALSPRRSSATQGRPMVEPGLFEVSLGGGQTGAVSGRVQIEGPAKELN